MAPFQGWNHITFNVSLQLSATVRDKLRSMSTGTLNLDPPIEALLDSWLEALDSRDPLRMAALYAADAVLLPTFSNRGARTAAEIADYFRSFMLEKPQGRLVEGVVRDMGEVAVHSGIYRFTLTALEALPELDVRFTFVYQRIAGDWKIVAHHSSTMPEG
jgi:uncharacterized protein (TIGR02246 family)